MVHHSGARECNATAVPAVLLACSFGLACSGKDAPEDAFECPRQWATTDL